MSSVQVVTCSEPRTFTWRTILSEENVQALLTKRAHWARGSARVGLAIKPEPPTAATDVNVSLDGVLIARMAETERLVLLPVLAALQELGLVLACPSRVEAVSRGRLAAASVALDLPLPKALLVELRRLIRGFDHLHEDKATQLTPASTA